MDAKQKKCDHLNPYSDEPCILVPPHDRLHLDRHGDRWFYSDVVMEEKRRTLLADALAKDAEAKERGRYASMDGGDWW